MAGLPNTSLVPCEEGLEMPEGKNEAVSQGHRAIEVYLMASGRLTRKAVVPEGILRPIRLPHDAIDVAAIRPE